MYHIRFLRSCVDPSMYHIHIHDIIIKTGTQKRYIELLGRDVRLRPTIGYFITMNPGYAGRSELPDNLKALFRPVTMIVPDLLMICDNMLMSEGFIMSKVLAKKMTVLYKPTATSYSKKYTQAYQLLW